MTKARRLGKWMNEWTNVMVRKKERWRACVKNLSKHVAGKHVASKAPAQETLSAESRHAKINKSNDPAKQQPRLPRQFCIPVNHCLLCLSGMVGPPATRLCLVRK